ncbi:hypothetical protein Tco_0099323 [Tanacetum coccineum]
MQYGSHDSCEKSFHGAQRINGVRDGAYENTRIYKERTKKWHDSRLREDKDFKNGDKVLLFNSRLKLHELCKTEEFTVVRHSVGNDEEFITVGPSKVSTVERTPGSMSCIYHELFNRKDHGWTEQYGDLAETMIWYILKKTCVELI